MLNIKTELKARNLGSPRILQADGRPLIAGIILHDTAGNGGHGDTQYLANDPERRGISVDYAIERDGTVYQLNPDLDRYYTFHAGRSTRFEIPGRTFRNREVTRACIGIELNQSAALKLSPIWPADQIAACAALSFQLAARYGFGKERITTHARVITDGSRSDPRRFPFDTFWHYFGTAAGSAIEAPPALGCPVIHEVKAAETLWKLSRQYKTTVEAIKELNGINDPSNVIRPGQKLIVKK